MSLNNFFEKRKAKKIIKMEEKAKRKECEREKLEQQLYYIEHEKEIEKNERKLECRHEYLSEKIYDVLDDVSDIFFSDFNYKKRISAMKKVISLYDELEEVNAKIYGKKDTFYLDEFNKEFDLKSKRSEIDIHSKKYEYQHEYEEELESISFLKKLLDYYEGNPNEVKKHLENEEYKYNRESYDTLEEYEENLAWEKEKKQFEKKFKKHILEHDGILQKDLLNTFDNKYSNVMLSCISFLVKEGKIKKEKYGNSCKIIVCNRK